MKPSKRIQGLSLLECRKMIYWAYRRKGQNPIADQVQDGWVALLNANRLYCGSGGAKFSTYALEAIKTSQVSNYRYWKKHLHDRIAQEIIDSRFDWERECDAMDARHIAANVLNALPPGERKVLHMRFHGSTLTEVGAELGITKERARQLESRGLYRARQFIQNGIYTGNLRERRRA